MASAKIVSLARIAVGIMFLFFGEYKVASPEFAHGGFQKYLTSYIGVEAVPFYGRLLSRFVLPHATGLGYFVGIGELLIGTSLVLGLWVRWASIFGMIHMLSLTLATWNSPGPGPVWRYFGAELDHIPLFFLFAIFIASHAGEVWGLDGRIGRR